MNIVLSIILNVINFSVLFYLMPKVSVVVFLVFSLVTPIIYNVLLFIKRKNNFNTWIIMIILSSITTLAYIIFAYLLKVSNILKVFIDYNTMNSGGLVVNIDENIASFSHILFIMLVQLCALFIVNNMLMRGDNND